MRVKSCCGNQEDLSINTSILYFKQVIKRCLSVSEKCVLNSLLLRRNMDAEGKFEAGNMSQNDTKKVHMYNNNFEIYGVWNFLCRQRTQGFGQPSFKKYPLDSQTRYHPKPLNRFHSTVHKKSNWSRVWEIHIVTSSRLLCKCVAFNGKDENVMIT